MHTLIDSENAESNIGQKVKSIVESEKSLGINVKSDHSNKTLAKVLQQESSTSSTPFVLDKTLPITTEISLTTDAEIDHPQDDTSFKTTTNKSLHKDNSTVTRLRPSSGIKLTTKAPEKNDTYIRKKTISNAQSGAHIEEEGDEIKVISDEATATRRTPILEKHIKAKNGFSRTTDIRTTTRTSQTNRFKTSNKKSSNEEYNEEDSKDDEKVSTGKSNGPYQQGSKLKNNITLTTEKDTEVSSRQKLSRIESTSDKTQSLTIASRTRPPFKRPSTSTIPAEKLEEEEGNTNEETTKRSFTRNRIISKTISKLSENTGESNNTEETVTRRTAFSHNRVSSQGSRPTTNNRFKTTTLKDFDKEKNEDISDIEEEDSSRKTTSPTYRQRSRLQRPQESNHETSLPKPDVDDKKYEVPTRRPFPGLGRLARVTTEATVQNDGVNISSSKPTKRVLGSIKRITTKISTEAENAEQSEKENDVIEENVTTKRSFPSRKPLGGINRETTTETLNDDKESTTVALEVANESSSTIRPTATVNDTLIISQNKASEIGIEESPTPTVNDNSVISQNKTTERGIEETDTNRGFVETSTHSNANENATSHGLDVIHRKKVIIKKLIRKTSTGVAQENSDTSSKVGFENPNNSSTTSKAQDKTPTAEPVVDKTKADEISTEATLERSTRHSLGRVRSTTTTTEVPLTVEDSLETSNKTATTTKRPLFASNRSKSALSRTTSKAPESTENEENVIATSSKFDKTLESSSQSKTLSSRPRFGLNRPKSLPSRGTTEAPPSAENEEEVTTISSKPTIRTYAKLNRLNVNSSESVTHRKATRLTLVKTPTKEREESNDDSSKSVKQTSFASLRKYQSADRNSESVKEEPREVTTRRSLRPFGEREKNVTSNSVLSTDSKTVLKPFNINRPKYQRPTTKPLGPLSKKDDDGEEYDEDDEEDEDDYEDEDKDENDDVNEENDNANTQDSKYSNKLANQRLASKEPNSALNNLRNRVRLETTQETDLHAQGLVNDRLKSQLTNRYKTRNPTTTTTNTTTKLTNTAALKKPLQIAKNSNDESNGGLVSSKALPTATNPNFILNSSSSRNSSSNSNISSSRKYSTIYRNRSSNSTVANYLNRDEVKTNTAHISETGHRNDTDQVQRNYLDKFNRKNNNHNNDDNDDDEDDTNDESTEDKTDFSLKSEFKHYDSKGSNDNDNDDSKRRFQKYQFQRRTSTPLPTPSINTASTSRASTASTTVTKRNRFNRLKDVTDGGDNGVDGNGDSEDDDDDDDNEDDDSVKANSQVNEKRATSTITPEILAPTATTTERSASPSSASHLTRRVKVLKFKRPINLNSSNNQTVTPSSATNSTNTVSAEAVDSLSSVSEIVEHTVEAHTLTVTQNETPSLTTTPTPNTPKRFRKVVRKLIRPVNRTREDTTPNNDVLKKSTTTITTTTTTEKAIVATANVPLLQRRPNATRYGFSRSTKFSDTSIKTNSVEDEEDDNEDDNEDEEEEVHVVIKSKRVQNVPATKPARAGSRFTLPRGAVSTNSTQTSSTQSKTSNLYSSTNRRYGNKPVAFSPTTSTSTTETPQSAEILTAEDAVGSSEEDEENGSEEEEEDDDENEEKTTTISGIEAPLSTTTPSTTTTELVNSTSSTVNITTAAPTTTAPEIVTTTSYEAMETTTISDDKTNEGNLKPSDLQKLRSKVQADLSNIEEIEGVLNDKLLVDKNATGTTESNDPLLKLRNKVQEDLIKSTDEVKEGVLSVKLLSGTTVENSTEKEDPLLALRNKVKEDLAKENLDEGILNDRLKAGNHTDVDGAQSDNPLLLLRNKVQQDLAKGSQEEGVVSNKLKKLLDHKQSEEAEGSGEENELQKIRQKVKAQLAKAEQEDFVVNNRLKKLLAQKSENTQSNTLEEETATEINESDGNDDPSKTINTRKPFLARNKPVATEENEQDQTTLLPITTTIAPGPKGRPTFRKLVAKRPFNLPTKPAPVSRTTTVKQNANIGNVAKPKNNFEKRKFGRFNPLNSSNRNTGEGPVRKDSRGNILPGSDKNRVNGATNGEDYDEYEDDDAVAVKPTKPKYTLPQRPSAINRPGLSRPPLFNRPQPNVLSKPKVINSQEHSADNAATEDDEEDDEDEDEDEEDDEDEDEEEEDKDGRTANKPVINVPGRHINRPTFKPKDNRVFPGSRPGLPSSGNRPSSNVPSRVANIPNANNRANKTASLPSNRFGIARGTNKPRVVNRPPGVVPPGLTIKPVAKNFEITTPLIPTKPAPFIPKNTQTYERKYTGPSTTESAITDSDVNSLIEDIDIEALNARNKKIFDINSKKHTTLKPKIHEPEITPAPTQSETGVEQPKQQEQDQLGEAPTATTSEPEQFTTLQPTQQHEQEQKHEHEQEQVQPPQPQPQPGVVQEQDYTTTTPSPLNGFATTPATPVDDTLLIGTIQNTDAQMIPSNQTLNVNAISPQDPEDTSNVVTTTQPPSTTLLHIFTLSDDENATVNPITENTPPAGPQVFAVGPDHMLIEVNRKTNGNIPGAPAYKVETSATVDKFSEVNGVKYIHQVQGHDIKIDGRSSVTDYTPIELTSPRTSQPVRNSLPEGLEAEVDRYGKALLPEVLREAVETSTISLEGLFDTMRKAKVLNGIDVVTTQHPASATEMMPESSTESTTTSSTTPKVQSSTLRHPATVNINGLTVTRRPVLSVRKRLINSPVLATTTATSIAAETSTIYLPNTVTTLQSQQQQQQQQQQQLSTAETSLPPDGGEFTTTSKFNRLRTPLRPFSYNLGSLTNTIATATVPGTTTPVTTLATYLKAGNNAKKQQRTENDLKVTSSPSASATLASASDNDISGKQSTKYPSSATTLRRKYQSRRLTTTTTTPGAADDSGTDPPRTQNPLFKRRFSLTTVAPFVAKTLLPSSRITTTLRAPNESATTTPPYFEVLDNEEDTDQVAKSSIHTSRFNQINGRPHIDDEDDEVVVGVDVVRHVVKSTQATSTTKQPTSRYLHHQHQQIYQQTKYNLEDVITRRMDGNGVGSAALKATTTRATSTISTTTSRPVIKKRKLAVKQRLQQQTTPTSSERSAVGSKRRGHKYQEPINQLNSFQSKDGKIKPSQEPGRTYRPTVDYDYYDDDDARVVGNRKDQQLKVILHGGGLIECLDQGNFPHPLSCRKFISCAKFETGGVVGWEYTCPKGLSYDPVGGMCNWASGLGCNE